MDNAITNVKQHAKSTRGFSLAEVLMVVAILIILMAIAVPNLIGMVKNLRQTELDASAETIYMTAQNQMSKLYASGYESCFQKSTSGANVYSLAGEPRDSDGNSQDSLAYITSNDLNTEGSAANKLFESADIDEELLGHSWVIEFAPNSGTIYAVYYGGPALMNMGVDVVNADGYQGGYIKQFSAYNALRVKSNRLKDALVGYHGGSETATGGDSDKLSPTITIVNEEVLTASIDCRMPAILDTSDEIVFNVTVADNLGHSYTKCYTYSNPTYSTAYDLDYQSMTKTGRIYHLDLTLDSLNTSASGGSQRFKDLYGSKGLASGTQLTVTVEAVCPSNQEVDPGKASGETNSLFAASSNSAANDTAVILYGRHLQNLDSDSGVVSTVTTAKQRSDLAFSDTSSEGSWYSTYSGGSFYNGYISGTSGTPNFKPISNSYITSFEGADTSSGTSKQYRISNLSEKSSSKSLGLFESINLNDKTVNFSNIMLAGTSLDAGTSNAAGCLAGYVYGNGTLNVNGCQAYLAPDDYNGKTNANVWIYGSNVGGLIGSLGSGATANMTSSAASTVLGTSGTTSGGGLVGVAAEGTTIAASQCYADSYITGANLGGLVGSSKANVTLTDCYAAGFVTESSEAAGLVDGAADMTRTYTAVHQLNSDTTATYYGTATSGSAEQVYYSEGTSSVATDMIGAKTSDELLDCLKKSDTENAFKTDTSTSVPYDLMDKGLTTYIYPQLKTLTHYGDWSASFQNGVLVYYEKYSGAAQEYGFYGANVEKTIVDNAVVIGDGYGIVYRTSDVSLSMNVTVTVGSTTCTLTSSSTHYQVTGKDENDNTTSYEIFPLSLALNNPDSAIGDFYEKVTISGVGTSASADSYYFNPHFAKTVKYLQDSSAAVPEITSETNISIRTARQLHNLSEYYDGYADKTAPAKFLQERSISYSEYKWDEFATCGKVTEQKPIGNTVADGSKGKKFVARYDGQCYTITDVSFVSGGSGDDYGDYVGFIGYNAGTVKNVVIRTDYGDADQTYFVQRKGDIQANQKVYMGVICGYNAGSISNTATAGYYLAGSDGTVHVYNNSEAYVGGFVGGNEGKIFNCASDFPNIMLSSNYAQVRAGGFIGANLTGSSTGTVTNCYAIGHIGVLSAKGGSIHIAGFAGDNGGIITSSYDAVALTASGSTTVTYGFSPYGGLVSSDCYYLDGGSYSYIDSLYLFKANQSDTTGTYLSYEGLKAQRSQAGADEAHTWNYKNTKTTTHTYPYRAVVKNADLGNASAQWCHYGDWQDEVQLGSVGAFYWEHEEYGSNNGYHFTFVCSLEDAKHLAQTNQGTSLCTSHDDGGVITEYGYGYYASEETDPYVTVKFDGLASGFNKNDTSTYNVEASTDIQNQMNNSDTAAASKRSFKFYAINTKVADSGNYLYLNRVSGDSDSFNGTMSLTYTPADTSIAPSTYTFTISPFFANALSYENAGTTIDSSGTTTNYSVTPGTSESSATGHAYEVRSVQQLQYLNWNGTEKNTSTLSNSGNYTTFNYLVYTKNTKTTKTSDLASAADETAQKRAALYWTQTHDTEQDTDSLPNFTPIAGTTETSTTSYNAYLYTWFGGHFDGQSYTIKNVSLSTPSFNVGLFGTTAGANIKDVIMYSDNDSVIERNDSSNPSQGAYAIGGLIGVAYDYDVDGAKSSTNYIENCAISGYTVRDASTCRQGLGETNVGGMFGTSAVNVRQCSAAVNIDLSCTHNNGSATWGIFIRVGGLTGAAQGYVTDCYSGGKISVSEATMKQWDFSGATHNYFKIFAGGIAGSAFTTNYANFTGETSVKEGVPTFENCYSYTTFPTAQDVENFESNTDSTHLFELALFTTASYADRTKEAGSKYATITNCYYLNSIKNDKVVERYVINTQLNNGRKETNTYNSTTVGTPISVDYGQMSGTGSVGSYTSFVNALNAGRTGSNAVWAPVTTVDKSGSQIDGKFSFPSDSALTGKNFPFATVVTQNDLTFGTKTDPCTVHVHYGDWPINGPYWTAGRDALDILGDKDPDADWAYKTFTINPNGVDLSGLSKNNFSFSINDKTVTDVAELAPFDDGKYVKQNDDGTYSVRIKALKTSMCTVTMTTPDNKYTATFVLEITANLSASAWKDSGYSESASTLYIDVNKDKDVYLRAVSTSTDSVPVTRDYSKAGNLTWNLSTQDTSLSDYLAFTQPGSNDNMGNIQRLEYGDVMVKATATYVYNGTKYTDSAYFKVTQKDMVGLANTTSAEADYEEAEITSSDTGSKSGEKKTYDAGTAPTCSGSNFFLYTSKYSKLFSSGTLTVSSVRIVDAGENIDVTISGNKGIDSQQKFYVDFSADAIQGQSYECIPGVIYRRDGGTDPAKNVKVTVVLKNEDTGAIYELTTTLAEVQRKVITEVKYVPCVDGLSEVVTYYPEGETFTMPSAEDLGFVNKGHYLKEWTGGLQPGDSVTASSWGMQFQASWDYYWYTVIIDPNGGETTCDKGTYKTKTTYGTVRISDGFQLQNTSRSGYEFVGWYDNDTGKCYGTNAYAYISGIEKDTTLTAKWGYVITYNVGDGIEATITIGEDKDTFTGSKSYNMEADAEYTLPTPSRTDGKAFLKWTEDAEGTGTSVTKWTPTGNKTFYAQWVTGKKVTLVSGNSQSASGYIADGETKFTKSFSPTFADGYKLDGYYAEDEDGNPDLTKKVLDADGNVCAAVSGISEETATGCYAFKLDNDVTLHALWKKQSTRYMLTDTLEAGNTYVITNGNTAGSSAVVLGYDGSNQSNTSVTPYESSSTYYESDGVFKKAGVCVDISDSKYEWMISDSYGARNVEYPKYLNMSNFTLAFSSSGSAGLQYMSDAHAISTTSANRYLRYYGSEFVDSWDNSSYGNNVYIYKQTYTYDLSWGNIYTITYVSNGSTVGTDTVAADMDGNATVTLHSAPDSPSASLSFDGWYDGTTKFGNAGETKTVTKNMTLTAEWKELATLTLSSSKGSPSSQSFKEKVSVTGGIAGYNKPTRSDGWELDGWWTKTDDGIWGTEIFDADGKFVGTEGGGYVSGGVIDLGGEDKTLYARWKRTGYKTATSFTQNAGYLITTTNNGKTYAIKQNGSGSSVSNETVTIGAEITGALDANGNPVTGVNSLSLSNESICLWTADSTGTSAALKNSDLYLYGTSSGWVRITYNLQSSSSFSTWSLSDNKMSASVNYNTPRYITYNNGSFGIGADRSSSGATITLYQQETVYQFDYSSNAVASLSSEEEDDGAYLAATTAETAEIDSDDANSVIEGFDYDSNDDSSSGSVEGQLVSSSILSSIAGFFVLPVMAWGRGGKTTRSRKLLARRFGDSFSEKEGRR